MSKTGKTLVYNRIQNNTNTQNKNVGNSGIRTFMPLSISFISFMRWSFSFICLIYTDIIERYSTDSCTSRYARSGLHVITTIGNWAQTIYQGWGPQGMSSTLGTDRGQNRGLGLGLDLEDHWPWP